MEVDLQRLFGLHVAWCAQLPETPQPPLPPPYGPALGLVYKYKVAIGQQR